MKKKRLNKSVLSQEVDSGFLGHRGLETATPLVPTQMLCVMRAWVNLQLLILKMFSLKELVVKD